MYPKENLAFTFQFLSCCSPFTCTAQVSNDIENFPSGTQRRIVFNVSNVEYFCKTLIHVFSGY